jgi:hypothetical protein
MLFNMKTAFLLTFSIAVYAVPVELENRMAAIKNVVCDGGTMGQLQITTAMISGSNQGGVSYGDSDKLFMTGKTPRTDLMEYYVNTSVDTSLSQETIQAIKSERPTLSLLSSYLPPKSKSNSFGFSRQGSCHQRSAKEKWKRWYIRWYNSSCLWIEQWV